MLPLSTEAKKACVTFGTSTKVTDNKVRSYQVLDTSEPFREKGRHSKHDEGKKFREGERDMGFGIWDFTAGRMLSISTRERSQGRAMNGVTVIVNGKCTYFAGLNEFRLDLFYAKGWGSKTLRR